MDRRKTFGVLRQLPRLRSGFRLRAQTPAPRLNFDFALERLGLKKAWWRCAQEYRDNILLEYKSMVLLSYF